jgi:hypothetical protein
MLLLQLLFGHVLTDPLFVPYPYVLTSERPKTILYIQSETTTGKDSFFIDGKRCEEDDECSNAFRDLRVANDKWMPIIENHFYRSESGIYLSSNFKNFDAAGRRIVFAFYTDSTNINIACDWLMKISKEVTNYDCDEKEIASWRKKECINESVFLLCKDKLIDGNGNLISSNDKNYSKVLLKFTPRKNWKQQRLENGFYFLNTSLFGINSKIHLVQYKEDSSFKFWIENPKSIDDTIDHLTKMSKYFGINISETDINILKHKANYGG